MTSRGFGCRTRRAYNIGAGISRSISQLAAGSGPSTSQSGASWVAREPTEARDGTPIDAGTTVLENRFRFHNAIARLGLGFAVPIAGEHALTFEAGGQLRAIRYRLDQEDAIQVARVSSTQGWNEWTRSWGVSYRFAGAAVQYRGNLTTGVSRPGFDDDGGVVFAPGIDSRPCCGQTVPFGLKFDDVRTTTPDIALGPDSVSPTRTHHLTR
jgi:hypothetical protein